MLILRGLKGVGEQHHHFCLYQWRLDMCCLISLYLCICPHKLLVSLFHGHRIGSVMSSYQIKFLLLQKGIYQVFHFLILILFSLMYQLKANLTRLSWKKNRSTSYCYESFQLSCCSMTEDGCYDILVWYTWWSPAL